MRINTGTNPHLSAARPAPALVAQPQAEAGHGDSVTLGSYQRPHDFKRIAIMTGAGSVPLAGAVINLIGVVGTGLNNENALSYLNFGAACANLVGTGSVVAGLLTGNSVATNVGLGMLGVSGLTAGATAFSYL